MKIQMQKIFILSGIIMLSLTPAFLLAQNSSGKNYPRVDEGFGNSGLE
ncbi:MAG: hypothetical protein FWH35_06320 [Treponema sp.]|nr:hypothetical protein [Treponema sp.]